MSVRFALQADEGLAEAVRDDLLRTGGTGRDALVVFSEQDLGVMRAVAADEVRVVERAMEALGPIVTALSEGRPIDLRAAARAALDVRAACRDVRRAIYAATEEEP